MSRLSCIQRLCLAVVLVGGVLGFCAPAAPVLPVYCSPFDVKVAPDAKSLYVADYTGAAVLRFDIASHATVATWPVGGHANGLALSGDGQRLYVACGGYAGELVELEAATGKELRRLRLGHTPMSPVLAADQKTLVVAIRFQNEIVAVDLDSWTVKSRWPAVREPVALATAGNRIFAANLIPAGVADKDFIAGEISVVEPYQGWWPFGSDTVRTIVLPNGAINLRGICASPDGRWVYATHQVARYQAVTSQVTRGWINTNAVTAVDTATLEAKTFLIDDLNKGAANPWAVACSPDGQWLVVTHAGLQDVSVIDRGALHAKLAARHGGPGQDDDYDALNFMQGIRHRVRLPGIGPRSIAFAGDQAYIGMYFSESLCRFAYANAAAPAPAELPLAPKHELTSERRGEIFFHDAEVCLQQWQSCVSCHPDARSDALNWDLMNDGIGNPKQSKSMLWSHRTPPCMATGIRPNAEVAVVAGVKYIQFGDRPKSEYHDMDTYLNGLEPEKSPHLVDGKLSPAAERGRKLFYSHGCATCHPEPLFTSLQVVDVGTGIGLEAETPFDVPTLVEVWRTAPYMHDGRTYTIPDLIRNHNPSGKRGDTQSLTEAEIQDLAEYILSL